MSHHGLLRFQTKEGYDSLPQGCLDSQEKVEKTMRSSESGRECMPPVLEEVVEDKS